MSVANMLAPIPADAAIAKPWPMSLLVVSDGSARTDAAVTRAGDIAHLTGARVEMLAIYSPHIPLPECSERHGFEQVEEPDRREAAALLRRVRQQRLRLLAGHAERAAWPLRLEVGYGSATVVRVAREEGIDLVVVGIGEVEPAALRVGGRTALYAARYLDAALFAAVPGSSPPSRCVVALPDSRADARILRAAARCAAPAAHFWIVIPRDRASASAGLDGRDLREQCEDALAGFGATVVGVFFTDEEPLAGLLRAAELVNAELIAVPNRGEPGAVRAFLPNIAEPLLASSRCSVLVVPDGAC